MAIASDFQRVNRTTSGGLVLPSRSAPVESTVIRISSRPRRTPARGRFVCHRLAGLPGHRFRWHVGAVAQTVPGNSRAGMINGQQPNNINGASYVYSYY